MPAGLAVWDDGDGFRYIYYITWALLRIHPKWTFFLRLCSFFKNLSLANWVVCSNFCFYFVSFYCLDFVDNKDLVDFNLCDFNPLMTTHLRRIATAKPFVS
jgi:hypothetical protein